MSPLLSREPARNITRSLSSNDERFDAYDRARKRWPSICLTFEQFTAQLERNGWTRTLPSQIEEFYLCSACSLADEPACRTLDADYFPRLRLFLARRHPAWDFVEEVLQQTRERLLVAPFLRIATYRGDGPLLSWLRIVASRIAIDFGRRDGDRHHRRALRRFTYTQWRDDQPGTDGSSGVPSLPQEDAAWLGDVERALLESLHMLDSAERRLLYMFHVQGLEIGAIATCLGVYRSTVYRRLHAVERQVAQSVLRALRARTGISDPVELKALVRSSYERVILDTSTWLTG